MKAVVVSSKKWAGTSIPTGDLMTCKQGKQEEVMRRKGGVKIRGWHKTDVKKDGEEAGAQVGRRTQELWWLKHVLLETQATFQ